MGQDLLDDADVWDIVEGELQNEAGDKVTGRQILDWVYAYHCRTFSRRFRVKYRLQSAVRTAAQRVVWRGQDCCLWLLEHGYEIRPKDRRQRHPLHQYRLDEFERQTDKDGTHFFGFQSSKRAFFSNVVVLMIACLAVYYLMPRLGIIRATYANPALTTVALALVLLSPTKQCR